MLKPARSWGGLRTAPAAREVCLAHRSDRLPAPGALGLLAHGLGRSYGDVALNPGGVVLRTRGLDRWIDFDRSTGVVRAEAGMSLAEVLALALPQGWMLPVTPGTRHVSLGGAVANDVHGKNHHRAGSFGHHVSRLALHRSDGETLECSADEHADLFRATVGGLGLTGLITWVELRLIKVPGDLMQVHTHRFATMDEFWALDDQLSRAHDHTVAWLDVGRQRGIYSASDFVASAAAVATRPADAPARWHMPVTPPFSLLGSMSCALFNLAYHHCPRPAVSQRPALAHLYPLDAVSHWNRIHGRAGFLQYQCVLPAAQRVEALSALLALVRRSGLWSALTVLKTFGDRAPAGLLSFPLPGVTLAMDFANRGEETLKQFRLFDGLVAEAGGRLYPAKDAHMSASLFRAGFPALETFTRWVDPGFSSAFWRRVSS